MQLNTSYTVTDNGTITLHTSQMHPNANLFQPGPALLFVVVAGVPSNGTMVLVGSGDFGTQPTSAFSTLPSSTNSTANPGGSGTGGSGGSGGSPGSSGTPSDDSSSLSTGAKIGIAAGGAAIVIFLAGLLVVCMRRRKNRGAAERSAAAGGPGGLGQPGMAYRDAQARNSDAFIPLQQYNNSAWDIPSANAGVPAHDLRAPMMYSDDQSPRPSNDTRATDFSGKGGFHDDQYYDAPPPQQNPRFGK